MSTHEELTNPDPSEFDPISSPDWLPPAYLAEDPLDLPENVDGFFDSVTMNDILSCFPIRIQDILRLIEEYQQGYPPVQMEMNGQQILVFGQGPKFRDYLAGKYQFGLKELTMKVHVREIKGKTMGIAIGEDQEAAFQALFDSDIPYGDGTDKKLAVLYIVDNDGNIIESLEVPIIQTDSPIPNNAVMATRPIIEKLNNGRFHLEIADIKADFKRINFDQISEEEDKENQEPKKKDSD
jgi:hypothetical protein